MGLFSKHKNDNKGGMPTPPTASSGSPPTPPPSMGGGNSAPPMPPSSSAPTAPPTSSNPRMGGGAKPSNFPPGSNIQAPPVPGGNLDEIKSQVSSPSNSGAESPAPSPAPVANNSSSGSEDSSTKKEHHFSGEDSLFDMFDLSMTGSDGDYKEHQVSSSPSAHSKSNVGGHAKTTNGLVGTAGSGSYSSSVDLDYTHGADYPVDTRGERTGTLAFQDRGSSKHVGKESCFLTTQQFRSMLEIVELVKGKVKDSTEIHLRLLDMKSEEDIEYENLRKNFQYVEDKLYELDSILFDN